MNEAMKDRALAMIRNRITAETGPLPQKVVSDLMLTGTVWIRVTMDSYGNVQRDFIPPDKVTVKE